MKTNFSTNLLFDNLPIHRTKEARPEEEPLHAFAPYWVASTPSFSFSSTKTLSRTRRSLATIHETRQEDSESECTRLAVKPSRSTTSSPTGCR